MTKSWNAVYKQYNHRSLTRDYYKFLKALRYRWKRKKSLVSGWKTIYNNNKKRFIFVTILNCIKSHTLQYQKNVQNKTGYKQWGFDYDAERFVIGVNLLKSCFNKAHAITTLNTDSFKRDGPKSSLKSLIKAISDLNVSQKLMESCKNDYKPLIEEADIVYQNYLDCLKEQEFITSLTK